MKIQLVCIKAEMKCKDLPVGAMFSIEGSPRDTHYQTFGHIQDNYIARAGHVLVIRYIDNEPPTLVDVDREVQVRLVCHHSQLSLKRESDTWQDCPGVLPPPTG